MLIEIKGKLSSTDLHAIVDILSIYFKDQGIEEFVEVDIDLKPFSKILQAPASLADKKGREIKSIKITKSKSGELQLQENAVDNTWMENSLGTQSPGELIAGPWILYLIGIGLLILYLAWENHLFF